MERSKNESSRSSCLPVESDKRNKTSEADAVTSHQWLILKEGFPPGFTVDELKKHRKKRPENFSKPQDNLRPESGDFKLMETEYHRRFVPPPQEVLLSVRRQKTEEWTSRPSEVDLLGGHKEQFIEFPRQRRKPFWPESMLKTEKIPMNCTTEKSEKYVPFANVEKTKLLRRNTALKPEGEILTETETKREFRSHGSLDRVHSLRRPSNLKLEGFFETSTEQKEKYIAYLPSRPFTIKRESHLKLDGEVEFKTECREKYGFNGFADRPLLRKRSTSLKLEGEVDFLPEYRRCFVELPRSKPSLIKPDGQLHPEGELDFKTEFRSKFTRVPLSEINVPSTARTHDNLHLEGPQPFLPEYREKFISHGKSKSEIIRKKDNLNLEGEITYETENIKYTPSFATSKKLSRASSSQQGHSNSEYHSKFVDFPRERPVVYKPLPNIRQRSITGTLMKTPPKSPQLDIAKTNGELTGEAEYKNKFIEFPVSYNRTPKPLDTFSPDYPSFQVLNASAADDGIERTNQLSDQPPTFRLEVHNCDEQPQGFHRSPERIYPRDALINNSFASKTDHEAAMRGRKSYERRSLVATRQTGPKSCLDENGNIPAFVVLDNC